MPLPLPAMLLIRGLPPQVVKALPQAAMATALSNSYWISGF